MAEENVLPEGVSDPAELHAEHVARLSPEENEKRKGAMRGEFARDTLEKRGMRTVAHIIDHLWPNRPKNPVEADEAKDAE